MAKIFKSNEILEMCDMHVSENGKMVVETKSFHSAELERLGTPEKVIRGRFKVKDRTFIFDPYAEQSRKPTYSKQVHVGSCTTLAVTADKLKLSMVMPRHMGKARTIDFIRAEIDDILHQLEGELYDEIVKTPSNLPLYGEALQTSLPTNKENTPEALPIEGELSEGLKGSVMQKGGEA